MNSKPIKVLLIEDDEDDYILTRDLLAEAKGGNYSFDWASSYEEGLKVVGRGAHQVCLVDYRLGELTGVQLIRAARDLGITTPMILLTGHGNHDVDVEAIAAGATDYLVKDETHASRLERTIRYAVELNIERCRTVVLNTARRRAEDELTARKLIEAELAHSRDVALESVRLKSEFLANMSHEIRTPMNGVVGMTNLLLDTELSCEQRKMTQTVKVCADSLLAIIDDILDFSKIEAGKLAVEMSDFDPRYTVESVVGLLLEQAHNKQIELAAHVHMDVSVGLRGDAGRLRQVLTNLIGNAVKFTEEGKVLVEVTQETNTDVETMLRFTIKDTGIGLPVDVQPRLFQPFTQADGSTTRKYGGTGLGLAISKQLVELMGGEIGFASEPGEGSTFWFTVRTEKQLPGTVASTVLPSKLVTGDTPVKAQAISNLRILLVEDYVINQDVAQRQLKKLGYQADVVEDGFAALKALELDCYDLVLMDCQMPVLDGYEACGAIRRREAVFKGGKHIPIIAMTANAMIGDREKCLAAGMDDYIAKPIEADDLKRVLELWSPPLLSQWSAPAAEKLGANPQTSVLEASTLVDKKRLLEAVGEEGHIPPAFVELYRRQMSEELNRLTKAIRSKSATEVIEVAHGCAGMNANCGMLAVVAPLRELERMGREGNLDNAELLANQVEAGFEGIDLFLTTVLETQGQLIS